MRLLLIEDDERIARLVGRALCEEGYEVADVADGPAGLRAAAAEPFDLIILDLMLPGMDGMLVLRKLMEHDPGQRVLVLSAVPEVSTRVACLELGAADFLGKPFSLDVMQRAGRPCTRMELLEDVWEMSFDPGSNVVDVYVRRLRAKPGLQQRIETVRNVGYRFAAA